MVEMDGGLVSGVTQGSTWAVRPVGAPPKVSDTHIRVKQVLPFVSHAKVAGTRAGDIKANSDASKYPMFMGRLHSTFFSMTKTLGVKDSSHTFAILMHLAHSTLFERFQHSM